MPDRSGVLLLLLTLHILVFMAPYTNKEIFNNLLMMARFQLLVLAFGYKD